jgi:hypothetical protein
MTPKRRPDRRNEARGPSRRLQRKIGSEFKCTHAVLVQLCRDARRECLTAKLAGKRVEDLLAQESVELGLGRYGRDRTCQPRPPSPDRLTVPSWSAT